MAEHAGSREVSEARRPHTWSRPCEFEEKQRKKDEIPPHPEHTRLKMHFLVPETPSGLASCYQHQRRYDRHAECATHRAATHLPVGIEGVKTDASTPPLRMSAGVLCLASNDGWCSQSLKNGSSSIREVEDQTGWLGGELIY